MEEWRRTLEGLGVNVRIDPAFWHGKRVLVTGHTGFKGAWLSLLLRTLGAQVFGFALAPNTTPSLYGLVGLALDSDQAIGDLRELHVVTSAVNDAKPEIVIHLAAQSLVLRSLAQPVETFTANVLGTVHLLQALRICNCARAILVVTTDKVYRNRDSGNAFREEDPLGGKDPYSGSKAAAELATYSYAQSYFEPSGVSVATARGGNVIGGGDFAKDRIVPDIYNAMIAGSQLVLRNPDAIRPWHYVLDCLAGYLVYAQSLVQGSNIPRSLNFGPGEENPIPVAKLVESMQIALGAKPGWRLDGEQSVEMKTLRLDCELAQRTLGWTGHFSSAEAIRETADWYSALVQGKDMRDYTLAAIERYLEL